MSKRSTSGKKGRGPEAELEELRRRIQDVDAALLDLIVERCRLARGAGRRKRLEGRPVLDPGQEASVVRRAGARAREAGIEEERVRQIFWSLIELSRTAQLDEDGGEEG